jgi:hypothetical protein
MLTDAGFTEAKFWLKWLLENQGDSSAGNIADRSQQLATAPDSRPIFAYRPIFRHSSDSRTRSALQAVTFLLPTYSQIG